MTEPGPNSTHPAGELQEFAVAVQQRADLSTLEEAEQLVRITLNTLAAQITRGQAEQLGAELPEDLAAELLAQETGTAEGFDTATFLDTVALATQPVDHDTLTTHVRAVFTTLRSWAPPGEIDDLVSQLPKDLAALFD